MKGGGMEAGKLCRSEAGGVMEGGKWCQMMEGGGVHSPGLVVACVRSWAMAAVRDPW